LPKPVERASHGWTATKNPSGRKKGQQKKRGDRGGSKQKKPHTQKKREEEPPPYHHWQEVRRHNWGKSQKKRQTGDSLSKREPLKQKKAAPADSGKKVEDTRVSRKLGEGLGAGGRRGQKRTNLTVDHPSPQSRGSRRQKENKLRLEWGAIQGNFGEGTEGPEGRSIGRSERQD